MTIKNDIDVQDIMRRYGNKLARQVEGYEAMLPTDEAFSREYEVFKHEAMGLGVSTYEKLARWAGQTIGIAVSPQDREEIQAAIDTSHIDVTPEDAASLAAIATIVFVFISILAGMVSFLITGKLTMSIAVLCLVILLAGFVLLKPLSKFPLQIASRWRLRAGSQMVMCILYMVMYMRHTSNLEHAIKFAGEHIGNPLALDLRKIYWDVETGKFSTIKESLDHYLERWRKWNLEFLESVHLIESSLYEQSEERRVERLEKSLQVMIGGTYERMLHFAHDVKTPITVLHMLGVILPILGLIILPLMGSFLGIKWWHLALVYNIILPITVYQMGTKILEKRPMGYGERNILEEEPQFARFMKAEFMGIEIDPWFPALILAFFIGLLGLSPLIIHAIDPTWDFEIPFGSFGNFLDYRESDTGTKCITGLGCLGPFGIGALILSLFFTISIALGLGLYYKLKTRKLIIIREKTKELEKEFSSSLFQLGNRIGDGLPAELAFGKVAETLQGTPTGDFFSIVNKNIRQLGMSVRDAIFDSEQGAILSFPSPLIESSMKVLVESARKGPKVVVQSLVSISMYMERIHEVNERLNDLLADVTSSMKGQISFLTPMIAGVVVGIGSMITTIIGNLGQKMGTVVAESAGAGGEGTGLNIQNLIQIFPTSKLMPPYFFQIVVGFYVLEIIFLLTVLSNQIQNGMDKISEKNQMGKNFFTSTTFYFIIALVITIIFSFLVGQISDF